MTHSEKIGFSEPVIIPRETNFLRCYDAFCNHIVEIVDMPEQTLDLLFRFT